LLKFGTFRNSEFSFWEEGYGSQHFPVAAQTLDVMIREQKFAMFRLLIPLWQQDAVVHGVLKLENGEEYPLSGFPRRLKSFARGQRKPEFPLPRLFIALTD
jgi:hypothetical protein